MFAGDGVAAGLTLLHNVGQALQRVELISVLKVFGGANAGGELGAIAGRVEDLIEGHAGGQPSNGVDQRGGAAKFITRGVDAG